jgi:hypothetical protein
MQRTAANVDERNQVDAILHSETLRGSDVLRHLLKFLAEKAFSGEADSLKEYTVAIDALQKPSTYNPQHDSTVRIELSRLRQKLTEYYRSERDWRKRCHDIEGGTRGVPRISMRAPSWESASGWARDQKNLG